MSESKAEEIIAALWAICCILCAANGYTIWAWVFGIKAAFDTGNAIVYAVVEIVKENAAKRAGATND